MAVTTAQTPPRASGLGVGKEGHLQDLPPPASATCWSTAVSFSFLAPPTPGGPGRRVASRPGLGLPVPSKADDLPGRTWGPCAGGEAGARPRS